MTHWGRGLGLLLSLAACAVMAGCSSSIVRADSRFEKALADTAAQAVTTRLDAITDFEWSSVHLFRDVWKGEDVNTEVGSHVMDDSDYQDEGSLLWVFVANGAVVRVVETPYYSTLAGVPKQSEWDRNVFLVPTPGQPGKMRFSTVST